LFGGSIPSLAYVVVLPMGTYNMVACFPAHPEQKDLRGGEKEREREEYALREEYVLNQFLNCEDQGPFLLSLILSLTRDLVHSGCPCIYFIY
jgi:hypothetical protein